MGRILFLWRFVDACMVLVRAPARVCVRAHMRLPSRVQVRLFVGKESTGVDVGRHGQLGAKVKIVWGHSEPPRRLLFWSLLFSWRVYFLVC